MWSELLFPLWPQVEDVVRTDLAYRANQLTSNGLARLLANLHPDITVASDGIAVRTKSAASHSVGSEGFALLPSAFVWPDIVIVASAPWPLTLVYPARGIGRLWSGSAEPAHGLTLVLGTTRATLLSDLGFAATTKTLAQRHRLSAATVSAQLHHLQSAGLVTATRVGKEVRYVRTPAANILIDAARG